MPTQNVGVLCGVVSTATGRGRRVRVTWETNSSGDFSWMIGSFFGELLSEKTTHKTGGATGTIDVDLQDGEDNDYLDGQHAAQAVNTTFRLGTVDNELRTGMESRRVRLSGPVWLVVNASTSAVHYGVTEFEVIED